MMALVALVALGGWVAFGDGVATSAQCAAQSVESGTQGPCGGGGESASEASDDADGAGSVTAASTSGDIDGDIDGDGAASVIAASSSDAASRTDALDRGATHDTPWWAHSSATSDATDDSETAGSTSSAATATATHDAEPPPLEASPYDEQITEILDRIEDEDMFQELSGGDDRITDESLQDALSSSDEEVRETARWLLDNASARHAIDVGDGDGDVDEEISMSDVRSFEDSFRTEDLRELLADTADGEGGDDDEIGQDDLVAMASDESLPVAYRTWAASRLDAGDFHHDDCSGLSLCQLGDAADAIGLDSVVDFVWDDLGLDSLVSNTFEGVFWRTWDNITNGAGAWYEWPGDLFMDSITGPLQIGGNIVNELWQLPIWARQSWEGRTMPGHDAEWHLPGSAGDELALYVRDDDDGADAIDPSDIDQRQLGTCVTLAGLGAIAAVDPDVIREAIHDNGDGTYTVTFHEHRTPGFVWDREWRTHEVTVDARVPVDEYGEPISAGAPNGELWPLIIEKAWAVRQGGYHRINGDNGSGLLEALTGHTASFNNAATDFFTDLAPGSSPRLPSFDTLLSWHEDDRAIITGSASHMRFILDVDPETHELTIGNPYGPSSTRVISYDEWKNSGDFITIAVASTD